jgi:branched-chain amino acid transport system ATP-binding protein
MSEPLVSRSPASGQGGTGIALEARDLYVGYVKGVDIVRGATLVVHEQEIVCILGPNGAGKSTLVKALFGLVRPRSGSVAVRGEETTGTPSHRMVRRGVGYVPQTDDVFADLSIEENLRMGAITDRAGFGASAGRVYDWFPVLADKRRAKAGSLSGGQRRLLGIGRALMTRPHLLLLDEPSAGLSPANVHEVFSRLQQVRDSGVAIAMVEQNAVEGLELADTGYILDQGRERISGPAAQLMHDSRVRDLYLGLAAEPDAHDTHSQEAQT